MLLKIKYVIHNTVSHVYSFSIHFHMGNINIDIFPNSNFF